MKTAISKETLNRKTSLVTSKLNVELRTKFVRITSIFGALNSMAQELNKAKIGAEVRGFGEPPNIVLKENGKDNRESN